MFQILLDKRRAVWNGLLLDMGTHWLWIHDADGVRRFSVEKDKGTIDNVPAREFFSDIEEICTWLTDNGFTMQKTIGLYRVELDDKAIKVRTLLTKANKQTKRIDSVFPTEDGYLMFIAAVSANEAKHMALDKLHELSHEYLQLFEGVITDMILRLRFQTV